MEVGKYIFSLLFFSTIIVNGLRSYWNDSFAWRFWFCKCIDKAFKPMHNSNCTLSSGNFFNIPFHGTCKELNATWNELRLHMVCSSFTAQNAFPQVVMHWDAIFCATLWYGPEWYRAVVLLHSMQGVAVEEGVWCSKLLRIACLVAER